MEETFDAHTDNVYLIWDIKYLFHNNHDAKLITSPSAETHN